ncbi:hypothetical protein ACQUSR_01165 [Streptomyces sp. P1-3]|uniref:hypothetical protein n=1 Tax=Streptomyces sp. P1-3 TaxID=3421658 RepID=UPI003D369DDF
MRGDVGNPSFAEHVRRFFWWPPGGVRCAAPVVPLSRVWLGGLVLMAGATSLGWEAVSSQIVVVGVVFGMLDDVIKGVRHRWPAFATGSVAGWAAAKGAGAGSYGGIAPAWADCIGFGVGSLVALGAFAVVTRLPGRRRTALEGDHTAEG